MPLISLVNVAVKAKADAIQLQLFKKELYVSPIYKDYNLISKLEITQEEWLSVIKLIKKHKILFFAAGYDIESIKFLINNEVDAFKVHSSDLSNPEILRTVARSQIPIFLSTGASTEIEINKLSIKRLFALVTGCIIVGVPTILGLFYFACELPK